MITVRVFGTSAYRKKLEKAAMSLDNLDKPMNEAAKISLSAVKSYPPLGNWKDGEISFTRQRPGSKYKRTGALGRGWKHRKYSSGKQMKITVWHSHPVSGRYFPYVAGRNQAAIHKPWWETVETWPAHIQPVILKVFRDYMKTVVVFKI